MIEDHARDIDIMQPFLRHRAIDAGLSDAQLRSSAFTQLVWGVHVSAEVPIDNYLMCKAALLAVPEASICGRSAARLWGAIVAHPNRGCSRGLNPPVSSRDLAM